MGPGTGPFTRAILDAIGPKAMFLAVEVNPRFAADLQARFPRARIINDSGERLDQPIASCGRASADCTLSGIRWASFPGSLQQHPSHVRLPLR